MDFVEINMPGISVAAVPFGMSFDLPDTSSMSSDLSELVSAISSLSSGAQQLSGGAAQAASGLDQLSGGSNAFNQGLSELSAGSTALAQGSNDFNTQLQSLTALAEFSQSINLEALGALAQSDPQTYGQLYGELSYLQGAVAALDQIPGGYAQLNSGLQGYTAGVDALASQYPGINSGIGQAAQGAWQLSNGIAQLSSGTSELSGSIQTMPEEMQKRIDEYATTYDFSGFEPHSYLSEKNTDVERVQFVLTTPALELPEVDDVTDDSPQETTILDRLIALFMPKEE